MVYASLLPVFAGVALASSKELSFTMCECPAVGVVGVVPKAGKQVPLFCPREFSSFAEGHQKRGTSMKKKTWKVPYPKDSLSNPKVFLAPCSRIIPKGLPKRVLSLRFGFLTAMASNFFFVTRNVLATKFGSVGDMGEAGGRTEHVNNGNLAPDFLMIPNMLVWIRTLRSFAGWNVFRTFRISTAGSDVCTYLWDVWADLAFESFAGCGWCGTPYFVLQLDFKFGEESCLKKSLHWGFGND